MLDDGGRRALAFASVVFDRASGLVILVTIGLGAWVARSGDELPSSLVWLAAGVMAALLLSWLLLPRIVTRVLPAGHRIRRFLVDDLASLWRDRALLGRVVALSAAFHLLEVTAQYVLAHALDVRVPYSYCLVFHPLVTVAASFPVTIGGLGLREGGYVFLLGLVGIDPALAFTMGLLWSVVVLFGGLVGGAVLLLGRRHGRAPLAASAADVGNERNLVSGSSRLPGR
jgi:uncharacterized membrane protein YbhN (UPF0104 family)